jgi:glycosyl transferase family 25
MRGGVQDSDLAIFVIHVDGNEARRIHMERLLKNHCMAAQFILDGNIETLNSDRLDRYFSGTMKAARAETSCAFKHILALSSLAQGNSEFGLILEDDIEFFPSFDGVFAASLGEARLLGDAALFVSYERYAWSVPKSDRKIGKVLYPAAGNRCMGCYLVNRAAAGSLVAFAAKHKCDAPIDLFIGILGKDAGVSFYWCYPEIAQQMSHSGKMDSLISASRASLVRRIKSRIKSLLIHFFMIA